MLAHHGLLAFGFELQRGDNRPVNLRSLAFWLAVIVLAAGIGFGVAVVLSLDLIFPMWDWFFRPPSVQFEGPAEWRKVWVSLGIGALVALGIIAVAFGRNRARRLIP
jgi:hypothetical protein